MPCTSRDPCSRPPQPLLQRVITRPYVLHTLITPPPTELSLKRLPSRTPDPVHRYPEMICGDARSWGRVPRGARIGLFAPIPQPASDTIRLRWDDGIFGRDLDLGSEGARRLVAHQAGSRRKVRVNDQCSCHKGGATPSFNTWMEGTIGS